MARGNRKRPDALPPRGTPPARLWPDRKAVYLAPRQSASGEDDPPWEGLRSPPTPDRTRSRTGDAAIDQSDLSRFLIEVMSPETSRKTAVILTEAGYLERRRSPYQSVLVRSTGALEHVFARSLRHVRTALAEDASPVAQATGAAAGGLLAENPALADYYRDSPEAALDLLRLIREATKEDRYRSARAALARREGKDDTRHDLCPPTGSDAPCSGSARRPSPS